LNLKNTQIAEEDIKVTINTFSTDNIKELEGHWLHLEKHSTTGFFLSWRWISSWLNQTNSENNLMLVKAQYQNNIIGLGLFVENKIIRHGFIKSTQWLLHRHGSDKKDQIWIENNDFLINNQHKKVIAYAIWQQLVEQKPDVDEFVIAMRHNSDQKKSINQLNKYTEKLLYSEKSYYLSMDELKSFDQYLSLLSKNTRQQIKRSIKLLKQLGDVTFNVITDEKQWDLLQQSKHWHVDKWQQTSTPSGFCNPLFTDFHQHLIRANHLSTQTIVASLQISNELVGCLYCFIDGESVYFYLSNLKPMSDNRIKLGLAIHAFFIEWLIENASHITKYDFLAGDARYKKSLTNKQSEYCYIVIQKKSLKFWLEDKLKLIKNTFK